jgi:hypothetical protein
MRAMALPEIRDLDTLQKACKRLGGVLDTEAKQAKFYAGQQKGCDAVIKFSDSTYEIAVIKNENGVYEIEADLYDSRLRAIVGKDCSLLSQAFQIEQHRKIARNQGYEVIERTNPKNGNIKLTIERR